MDKNHLTILFFIILASLLVTPAWSLQNPLQLSTNLTATVFAPANSQSKQSLPTQCDANMLKPNVNQLAFVDLKVTIEQNFARTRVLTDNDRVNLENTIRNNEFDHTKAIQDAIDECSSYTTKHPGKRCSVVFGKNKTYNLSLPVAKGHHGLIVSGTNISIYGCNATILNKSNYNGPIGDSLDVIGLLPGYLYPNLRDAPIHYYLGAHKLTQNIEVRDLTIKEIAYPKLEQLEATTKNPAVKARITALKTDLQLRNCIGLTHVKNVKLININCVDAPQTSFAAVSSRVTIKDPRPKFAKLPRSQWFRTEIRQVLFKNLVSINSRQHSYRVHLQDGATALQVTMDGCSSLNVVNPEASRPLKNGSVSELRGIPVHLYYRGGLCDISDPNAKDNCGYLKTQPNISNHLVQFRLINNFFDPTGKVVATQGTAELEMANNVFLGGIWITVTDRKASGGMQFNFYNNALNCSVPLRTSAKPIGFEHKKMTPGYFFGLTGGSHGKNYAVTQDQNFPFSSTADALKRMMADSIQIPEGDFSCWDYRAENNNRNFIYDPKLF